MENWIEISFRDSVVSRDGRPFGTGQGNRMRSAGWPLPSVVAGSLRSAVGKAAGREFSAQTGQDLLGLEVAGGLPFSEPDRTAYYPAPQDCVVRPEPSWAILAARPQEIGGGGCDLPHAALRPVMLADAHAGEDFKPGQAPSWWPGEKFVDWMLGTEVAFDNRFLAMPRLDARTHVYIDPKSGAAADGKLFSTTALALGLLPRYGAAEGRGFRDRYCPVRMALRVRGEGWTAETAAKIDSLHPLGGERKLACWEASEKNLWSCPDRLAAALATAKRVRMVLAAPSIFSGGWKPGWLGDDLTGKPPGADVTLRLVGVSIRRWQAVSGWSLAEPRGPKAIRRMVPAGGVYFFDVASGSAASLANCWLEPVSDGAQECRDGFGLATWGIW
ncbi:MAG: type III-B CRISPR module-associated Cmr3 family protein [Phycisphaerae bacterium]